MTIDGTTYWKTRWDEIAKMQSAPDWQEHFRSDLWLRRYIRPQLPIESMIQFVNGAKIPMALARDTLFGGPEWKGCDDVPVTKTSLEYAYIAHRVGELCGAVSPLRILEIGGGFGGLVFQAYLKFGETLKSYTIVDDPSMHGIQREFVGRSCPGVKAEYVTDVTTEVVTRANVVIATKSLGEMSLRVVQSYIDSIESNAVPGLCFYIVTWNWNTSNLDKYVFSRQWKTLKTVWPTVFDHNPCEEWFMVWEGFGE